MLERINKRGKANERGQAMAEFALVLPVLMLVLLGIIQCGIVFNNYLTLTDAVRAGSREAAVSRGLGEPAAVTQATNRVKTSAGGSLDENNLNITVTFTKRNGPTLSQGDDVTVKATYPFEINVLGIDFGGGNLTSETTERVE